MEKEDTCLKEEEAHSHVHHASAKTSSGKLFRANAEPRKSQTSLQEILPKELQNPLPPLWFVVLGIVLALAFPLSSPLAPSIDCNGHRLRRVRPFFFSSLFVALLVPPFL